MTLALKEVLVINIKRSNEKNRFYRNKMSNLKNLKGQNLWIKKPF